MPYEPLVHTLTPPVQPRRDDWWRSAVIYQIYPRSFRDSNGDGVGDLPGIVAGLDHVASLGADAIWISPFYKSPMRDFGYDVSDYRAVEPVFGTLADFDRLIERAHAFGLKVLIDLVPAHTSNEHPWFQESRQDRGNPKADWYVWADPKSDGTAPNNWLAVFGGIAWEWEPRRGQYYQHNFLKEQPQLNLHHPPVVEALLDVARFWLDRGVDGFRLDAIDWAVQDPLLRSNPPRRKRIAMGDAPGSPFSMQQHLYNKARPELADLFLKPFHRLTEQYQGIMLLGEVSGDFTPQRAAAYTHGGGLDTCYTFDLIAAAPTAEAIRATVQAFEKHVGGGWITWALGNHDVRRPVTRFGGDDPPEPLRRMLPVLLGSLRGTICLYQGEELGLEEVDIPYELMQDPFGLAFWPAFKGRDGCRTPLPWSMNEPNAGFSTGPSTWLPIPPSHQQRAIDRQSADHDSVLNHVRRFLHWRRGSTALRTGTIRFLPSPPSVLAFERAAGDERLTCWFNISPAPVELRLRNGQSTVAFAGGEVELARSRLRLGPFAHALLDTSLQTDPSGGTLPIERVGDQP